MSIGAELPPPPVQCPVCRRFERVSDLQEVEAKAIGQPTFRIAVCGQCFGRLRKSGVMRVMVNGEYWCVGLKREAPIGRKG